MSSSSFSQGGEQSVLGTEGGLGGQVGGDTTDIDIEAPGMEAVMDDLALPAQHSSTSDGSATRPSPTRGDSARRGNGGAGGGNSTSGTSANSPATGSSAAGLNAAVAAGASRAAGSPEGSPPSSRSSSSDSSVSFGLKRQRKSSMWRRSGSGNNRVAADLEEYGGAVVGKDGRRRSSGSRRRRSSGEGSGRRGSNGLLDRWVGLWAMGSIMHTLRCVLICVELSLCVCVRSFQEQEPRHPFYGSLVSLLCRAFV